MTIASPVALPDWASNANYATGPDVGTPTKVDPGSAADGFIKGVVAAPQHVNHALSLLTRGHNQNVGAVRRLLQVAALQLRQVSQIGVTVTDVTETIAAVQRNRGTPLVVCKTAQAFGLGDWSRIVAMGVPASIATSAHAAATDGSRILLVGVGGNRSTFSDDDGVTWTAGGNVAGTALSVVWNAADGFFLTTSDSSSRVRRSTNGVAWADSTGFADPRAGLAVLANGDVYAIGGSAGAFSKSTDSIAFADTASGVPGFGVDLDDQGYIAGNAGTVFYCASRHSSGANIQIHSSSDGVTLTPLATLFPQGSASFASQPRLLMCQNTGLLVLVAPTSGNQCALYASTDGADWVGPSVLFPDPGILAFALAGGKLISTINDMLFASDGVGY
jgi:hypothetical protein